MKEEYKPLFTPWKIGNLEIKNRIVMTSMGGTSLFGWMEPLGNHFDKEAANFILERARNNVGLILPGIAPIRDILWGKWLYKGKGKFKELKEFMDEFHKTGSKLFIQLGAGFGRSLAINHLMAEAYHNKLLGTLLKPVIDVDYLTASASATPNRWLESVMSRPMTEKEIQEIIDGFAKTAKLCQEAGVDGIEVHAVHEGYLLDQFTMKYTNFRDDKYGGSFENRYRFPVEIVQAIKKECGKDFPVSLRYSVVSKTKGFGQGALPGEEYTEVGRDMEESRRAAKYLQDAGYDMLNCDNGTYDAWYWAHPPGYMPHNCNLEDVEEIRKSVDIPVVCAGRMTPLAAAESVKEKKIDAMGVARQFLTDPEWITKLMNGDEESIKPCICCHNACFSMAHYKGVGNDQSISDNAGMARCALNPTTMQSKKYKIVKTKNPKHIAIIGAGIGGMEVARLLTLRGHKVTIYEKTDRVGGVFTYASTPAFKDKEKALLDWYEKEMKDLQIEIKFNTEVTDLDQIDADEVVVAIGATPKRLKIKGFENTIEACDYLKDNSKAGDKIVIIGGGLTGCEIALDLYQKGKTPIIVEARNDLIAVRGVCLANSSYLREFFALNNVDVHLEASVQEITKDGVAIKNKDGEEIFIEADTVIMSIGYNPKTIPETKRKIHLVGDCHEVGNLRTVTWRAWDVGMKI